MSLPKRDGVHDRYYLIHKPDTSPEVLAEADLCIQDVLNGTARENHSAYPTVVRNHNGTPFLPNQLLERYLSKLPLKGFPYEEAVTFCDALRRLVGWQEIRYTLEKYIEKQVQERFFLVGERDDGFTVFPPCTVWPELRPEDVDEGLLRFACYVAVCHTVYGQSFESLTTEHILGLVSQLRPDMVKQLKTAGSGKLPKDIQQRKETPMKLYEYWLGLYPLDWEFCFMPVQTYKNFITEQYHKNPAFYNISAGSIEKVLTHIDAILSAAMEDWNKTTNHAALRCPPMIFPLPKGQESNIAEFAVILKMDHDGDTVVYSPIPLPHLENQ